MQTQTRNWAQRSYDTVKNKAAAVGVGLTALVGTGLVHAQSADLGAAALAEVSGAKASISPILLVIIAVCFLFVLFSMIKRAK